MRQYIVTMYHVTRDDYDDLRITAADTEAAVAAAEEERSAIWQTVDCVPAETYRF